MREDPTDASLLYAGTVTSAYVSFDRGDHWQSLQLNLPTTVISDMTVRDADLDSSHCAARHLSGNVRRRFRYIVVIY